MEIKVLNKSGLPLPKYMSSGAACMDICVSEKTEITSGDVVLCHTGLYVEIPKGWCLKLYERSSLHKQGLSLANGVGVIDSDYRGEIMVPIYNFVDGSASIVYRGARVAQAMIERVETIKWVEVDDLEQTERGEGGFGSTEQTFEVRSWYMQRLSKLGFRTENCFKTHKSINDVMKDIRERKSTEHHDIRVFELVGKTYVDVTEQFKSIFEENAIEASNRFDLDF